MDQAHTKRIIEALLFVFSQPVALKRIGELLPDAELPQIRSLIQTLNTEYMTTGRAFHIQEVAGGYQLVTDQAFAPWVKRALQSPKPDAVSTAALETLAIIAYRQPITKAEIEAVRGVDVTASLDTLVERKFVRIAGRKESPGRPFLYATTPEFLRHFGLQSLAALPGIDLPTVKEPAAEPVVQATPPTEAGTAPSGAVAEGSAEGRSPRPTEPGHPAQLGGRGSPVAEGGGMPTTVGAHVA